MKSVIMPFLHAAKLKTLRMRARSRRCFPPPKDRKLPVRFIMGCGRSGTTILGHVIAKHPDAKYLREPYHLWCEIDQRMDVTGLHSNPAGTRFFMRAEDVTPQAKARFELLISRCGDPNHHKCVIEKTPHNAGRIGWINSVEPDAKLIHIVRNGLSVTQSINSIASDPFYTIAFKKAYNQWWGQSHCKWDSLSSQGAANGYFPDEVPLLESNAQRAAYEWLVSIGEIDRWRKSLGERLLEITYTQLTTDPRKTCNLIAQHLEIGANEEWLDQASKMLRKERAYPGTPLLLPPKMTDCFNEYQQRYGFDQRAGRI